MPLTDLNPPGILPAQNLRQACETGIIISNTPLDDNQIQPASIDLRLGSRAFRIRASFLPGKKNKVSDKLERYKLHEIDIRKGAVLETDCVYLIPLQESLALPETLSASANPKSSTGRLDIFTRVIPDYATSFDKIVAGYKGALYAEVCPKTFPVLVREGSRLSQLRFRLGDGRLTDEELLRLHQRETLVDQPVPMIADGLGVSVDLMPREGSDIIGYRARRHTSVVDVDKREAHKIEDFWDPLHNISGAHEFILDPNEFYILMSREAIHIPAMTAAEMIAYDPMVGEFRVHYAGFCDPGFGASETGGANARVVLEVRSHEVPFILEHGQPVGRLIYEHMTSRPDFAYGAEIGSNYQGQRLKLSKHFIAS